VHGDKRGGLGDCQLINLEDLEVERYTEKNDII